jgi:hypothetical protein
MKLRRKQKTSRAPNLTKSGRNMPINNYYRSPKSSSKPTIITNNEGEKKGKKFSLTRAINILIVVGGVGLVVFATTLTTTPKVELKKDNAEYYELSIYEKAAQEAIKSSFLNRSKLLFQSTAFENKLKEMLPEISQVKPLVPIGGRNLSVIITLSEPFAYVSSGSDNGIVNRDGILVVKNGKEVPSDLLRIRFTEPQTNFDVGSRILTSTELDTLSLLQSEMNSLVFVDSTKASIKDVLFDVSQGQIEANLQNKAFFIKLSTFNDGPQQVGGAKATLKQLDRENTLPTKYIDVRVPGRAFVI